LRNARTAVCRHETYRRPDKPHRTPALAYRSIILDAVKSFGVRVQLVGFIPTALAIALVVVMVDAHAPDGPLTFTALKKAAGGLGPSGITVIVAVAAQCRSPSLRSSSGSCSGSRATGH
jgi:hypothetical protein